MTDLRLRYVSLLGMLVPRSQFQDKAETVEAQSAEDDPLVRAARVTDTWMMVLAIFSAAIILVTLVTDMPRPSPYVTTLSIGKSPTK